MTVYLVGVAWMSLDQGDFPNTASVPKYCFDSLQEAEEKYKELAVKDRRGSFYSEEAYLVKATGGHPLEVLHGDLRNF